MSYAKSNSIGSIHIDKEILFSEIHPTEQAKLMWADWALMQLRDGESGSKLEIETKVWLEKLMTIMTDQELSDEDEATDDLLVGGHKEKDEDDF